MDMMHYCLRNLSYLVNEENLSQFVIVMAIFIVIFGPFKITSLVTCAIHHNSSCIFALLIPYTYPRWWEEWSITSGNLYLKDLDHMKRESFCMYISHETKSQSRVSIHYKSIGKIPLYSIEQCYIIDSMVCLDFLVPWEVT